MGSNPNMPDDLRRWITMQAQGHPERHYKNIREDALDWIKTHRPNYPVPGDDVVRKAVKNAREVKSPLDEPWSLGAPEQFNIPNDATPDLLALLKRSIIGDTKFTIRQAIWAARLKDAVSDTPTKTRLKELRYWAGSYAAAERVAEALGEPLDTSSLDSYIVFRAEDGSSQWTSWLLASSLGAIPGIAGMSDKHTALAEALTVKVGAEQARQMLYAPDTDEDSDEVQEIRRVIQSLSMGGADTVFYQDREDLSILLHRTIHTKAEWKEGSDEDRERLLQRFAIPSVKLLSVELLQELLQDSGHGDLSQSKEPKEY